MRPYVYVFIRLDLPRDQRIIQAVHAALRAGAMFYSPELDEHGEPALLPRINVVLIGVRNEAGLVQALGEVQAAGFELESFREPDLGGAMTSFATQLVPEDRREFFTRYKLYGTGSPSV